MILPLCSSLASLIGKNRDSAGKEVNAVYFLHFRLNISYAHTFDIKRDDKTFNR